MSDYVDRLIDPTTGEWYPNDSYKEILVLMEKMDAAGIPFVASHFMDGWQVCYPKNGDERVCSCIEHYGSYGKDDDKLEIMGLLTTEEQEHGSVVGWLTADEVFSRISKHWQEGAAERHDAELLEKAIRTYGKRLQMIVAVEELSELQKEICKRQRGADNKTAIAEEIADVEIMLAQLKIMFDCKDEVAAWKRRKIKRLAENLELDANEVC